MKVSYAKCVVILGTVVTLVLLLAAPVTAKDLHSPNGFPLLAEVCWQGECNGIPHPDGDSGSNNGTIPDTDCPDGWVSSHWGCKPAPGSVPCGKDMRCEAGTICANDEECLPLNSVRVCSNKAYCSAGYMCLSDNKTCLLLTSERVCSDQKHYCANEYDRCFEDNTCYRPSGNGLIAGTTWVVGYNEQNTDPAVVAKARERLRTQFKLYGKHYDEAIDFKKYQFVLGIGVNTESIFKPEGWAEGWRVFLDNFTNGQHSAETQGLYNSLKGRAFGELGCHSNGAMICLAALENKDVRAERVVLYGPQITAESLLMWNDLVKRDKVKSVQIYINQNDPIPALSILFTSTSRVEALLKLALFKRDILASAIRVISPDIDVITLDKCKSLMPSIDCHDLKKYK